MKKLLTVVAPLAMLAAFASVSLATDETAQSGQDLNQELNAELSGELSQGAVAQMQQGVELGDSDAPPSDTLGTGGNDGRGSASLADRRGRQPRRGQTAEALASEQKYWGDHKSGKEDKNGGGGGDEQPDEDEDPDQTPPGN